MKLLKKLACCAAISCLAVAPPAMAQLYNASTYANLTWGFSTTHAGFSGCGTLTLDATGALGYSNNFSVYGTLYCANFGGSYANSGNAYFDSAGGFNMTISLGVTHNLLCNNLSGSTLSGSCPIYDNAGNQTGTAFINLL